MPHLITVKNDKPTTILSPKDFEDLIAEHMGYECANFYREQIEQLSDCIRDLDSYVDDKLVHMDVEEVLKVSGY